MPNTWQGYAALIFTFYNRSGIISITNDEPYSSPPGHICI